MHDESWKLNMTVNKVVLYYTPFNLESIHINAQHMWRHMYLSQLSIIICTNALCLRYKNQVILFSGEILKKKKDNKQLDRFIHETMLIQGHCSHEEGQSTKEK